VKPHDDLKQRLEHAIRLYRSVLQDPMTTPSEHDLAESTLRLLEADKKDVHPSILLGKLNAFRELEVRAEVLSDRQTQNPRH
jgi:hypothetical protein